MKELLERVMAGLTLEPREAEVLFEAVADGRLEPVLLSAFLVAMRMRGERAEELSVLAKVMIGRARTIAPRRRPLLDIVGTGGDGLSTLNISTLSALIVAGAGVAVAKHGNRAVSSSSGSADVLLALGLRIDAPPGIMARAIDEVGFGFLFAPLYHPAMAHAAPVRQQLGIRTLFNYLGPLINPADPEYLLVGTPTQQGARIMAQALRLLGKRAMVIHGLEGLDEVSPQGETLVLEVTPKGITERILLPEDFGLDPLPIESIKARAPGEAFERARRILRGESDPGLQAVLMEGALGLYLVGKTTELPEGVRILREVVASGKAWEVLQRAKEMVG
ncbi:MAG: anthranilate phosphoribosyltransferase [Deltaproteobacteria bacterium]|nr:MAG: anthranilate phosphoribosyltransferase [Deltaproteobacteria bacterium]